MRLATKIGWPAICTASVLALLCTGTGSEAGAAGVPACSSFGSQADAQAYFTERGGSPIKRVGDLDSDRDGVACEGLPAPYAGFATIAYNKKRHFLYGVATMPSIGADGGGFACLEGNRFDSNGPRRLNVYAERPGDDIPLLDGGGKGVEAKPATGHLPWKVDRSQLVRRRYYVTFEARIRLSPYGRNQCPAFSSRPTVLP